MDRLFESFELKGLNIKNRVCFPPCVCFTFSDEKGFVTDKNVDHYIRYAKGGAGLIIQEATCVSPNGKLSKDQLGIWSDEHIPGLRRIVDAVHAYGVPIFVQIHHAGVLGVEDEPMLCPSEYSLTHRGVRREGREMTKDEIEQVISDFAQAARRAVEAGYDGIELHGCHKYLICQFNNNRVNRRTDEYGAKPTLFMMRVYEAVKKVVPEDFVVGIRLGAFEPTLSDGIAHAKEICDAGIDFIDVSYGFDVEHDPEKPADFPFVDIVWAAGEIKKNVSCPVFAVNSIRTGEEARGALELTGVDMIDIARGMLANPNWPNEVKAGEDPKSCLWCKECMWRIAPEKCPGRKLHYKG